MAKITETKEETEVLQDYNFPAEGVTISAKSQEEAHEKLKLLSANN